MTKALIFLMSGAGREEAGAVETVKIGLQSSILDSIWSAGLIVQLTLLLLVCLSVISWAIIFAKRRQFAHLKDADERFLTQFWKASSLDTIYEKLSGHQHSPIANIFKSGYTELAHLADSNMKGKDAAQAPKLTGIDNLTRALRKSLDNEVVSLEQHLVFLASTSNLAPFVGLFGTVWGIMTAFHKIGATGTASLAVVAPGISEALIATAIGLATALPAGAAYNFFLTALKREEVEMSNFVSDFLNIAKRNFFQQE